MTTGAMKFAAIVGNSKPTATSYNETKKSYAKTYGTARAELKSLGTKRRSVRIDGKSRVTDKS
ncbi:MAG: hypothetical protein E6J74_09500 [Deltaproteobacteria bacterium]|nr:MAG: hypothetical protein E6J74_09500 [Deltaproteobacteria bacterium]